MLLHMPQVGENSSDSRYVKVAPYISPLGWTIFPYYDRLTGQQSGEFGKWVIPYEITQACIAAQRDARIEIQERDPWFRFRRGLRQMVTAYKNSIAPS